ncbi:hypothetical protein [Paraburkholderia hospita]|uniref:hypothetical protein n=1 Tax=Paraburkholderia hospita TaxID=169430 RepID=UPI000271B66D|nr:hypothetical protein [Paraburkholderia hospita]EUC12349.1 hypothetical protein PMI06_008732 [Burkholderia sp. BT03]SKC51927.1 hypothetical protein SAMN06266956_0473 [Paraburkholderia hospita]
MAKSKRSGPGFPKPYRRRPPAMVTADPASTALAILGIEVVQCVQDLANSVQLIANKATVVRVYLDPASVTRAGKVAGEIAWSRGAAEAYLPALNTISIDPSKPAQLNQQRADASNSLNFKLPPEALEAGQLRIRLSRLFQPGGADLPIGDSAIVDVVLNKAPPLRIRVIGLRYNNGERDVSPAAIHFAYLKSFLLRAYPIASLEWSQIVVDADFKAPLDESTADLANAQLAALRSREVSSGVDARTHYFGLVDDDGSRNFMRGKAFTIPGTPQPDVVASGPAGVPNGFAGDRDASYADWYGAHELGHTFGRYHPGFPQGQQDASDANFPYANGCISTPDGTFAGLDVGDPTLNLPIAALAGIDHHDVMTYANDQWLSPYTYKAILDRLIAEDTL